ncbi:tetratricopeptide repeat protein [Methanospirillum sp. J.3.6.1-F.2.7.3]|uniref:Tetratricopeptide repeat protein n=1 Tax=Methanospirillum purgamenti TaxID=2834276 RepID=A0A8E7EK03_9EURY|nr:MULTISPECIES: tetratricopeptide repeat protein [Methanospirillum]MDX8551864.1 tetratricopeptide repeat protein [Methanospirillum hungatei]QVV89176.1 tetratricopeptide repeat protein [Methanospirillum sp. J.3.6.1-F.2.7.3]
MIGKIIVLIIISLFIGGVFAEISGKNETEIAKQYLIEGKNIDALDLYDQLLLKRPNNSELWNNRGVALLRMGNCTSALQSFIKALELENQSVPIRTNIADAYSCSGEIDKAILYTNEALVIDPDNVILLKKVAEYQREMGDFDAAVQAYRNILSLNASDIDAINSIGELSYLNSNFTQAIQAYLQLVNLSPDDDMIWYNLGVNYEADNQFAKAVDAYNQSIKINASNYKAWSNMGMIYYSHNHYNESLYALDKVVQIRPDYSDAWFIRAIDQKYLGDINGSVLSFENASALAPNDTVKKAYYQKYAELSSINSPFEGDSHMTPLPLWIIMVSCICASFMICRRLKK